MFAWLNGPGRHFKEPLPGSTNYLGAYDKFGTLLRAVDNENEGGRGNNEGNEDAIRQKEEEEGLDAEERAERAEERAKAKAGGALPPERERDLRPYPLNNQFRSQPVLSEELREELYRQVVERKLDVATVSAAFGVDMRRVAAVVRLKTVEKQWIADGKKLARPYAKAVLEMVPTTPYDPQKKLVSHEPINDLPVHPATRQQIFHPTSESRQFTRDDAAKVFSPTLLPADKRIPHPELIQLEKWNLEELPREERTKRIRERDAAAEAEAKSKAQKQQAWEERTQRVVTGRRWDFKFQDVSAEDVGKDGRGRRGVGHRYGMPHEDRKRGIVKIPTSVE
ncbi:hypothetical protein MBLNU230_g6958t2 [Neophaeotheca triangularis]